MNGECMQPITVYGIETIFMPIRCCDDATMHAAYYRLRY